MRCILEHETKKFDHKNQTELSLCLIKNIPFCCSLIHASLFAH